MRSRILALVYLLLAWPAIAQTTYVFSPIRQQRFSTVCQVALGAMVLS
jgi:hypothetical protein